MALKIIRNQPDDVYVTASELVRYRADYEKAYSMYAGTPPTLEDYIRQRQVAARKAFDVIS